MPTAPFIGRAAQLAEIAEAWQARRPGIILITGEGGSGKSRLVAEIFERLDLTGTPVVRGAARSLGAAPHDWLASVLSGRPAAGLNVDEALLNRLAQRSADGAEPRLAPATTLRAAVDVVRALLEADAGRLDERAGDPASTTVEDLTVRADKSRRSASGLIRHFTKFRGDGADVGTESEISDASPSVQRGRNLGIVVVEDLHDLDPASLSLVAELAAA
ncbi:MAG TPA: ATP-binding protein, partial [Dactylosporangium sp.]|nr:ATP-binding protein [Dactylosporangium sp.]